MVDISVDTTSADTALLTADNSDDSTFAAPQYSHAARSLLPPGRAWNREDGSNQAAFCDALGAVYAQQDADCVQMLADFFPSTATEGIDEWNAALALPDPCGGAPTDQAANQQQIVAKLIASGGQTIPYYTSIAAALGYVVSITEFSPTEPGSDAPDGFITNSSDWAHSWRVNILNPSEAPSDTTLLRCLLDRYKPAHTQFYIVDGSSPDMTTRLFEVTDAVNEPLSIEIPAR